MDQPLAVTPPRASASDTALLQARGEGRAHSSGSGAALDALCELAARLLRVSAAVASLQVEDRVLVIGSYGYSERARSWGGTPLSLGLGHHGWVAGEALAIRDLTRRALLAADPIHAQEGFRALLALPVHAGGEVAGTLCALAREPRLWSTLDQRDLALAAALIGRELGRLTRRAQTPGSAPTQFL